MLSLKNKICTNPTKLKFESGFKRVSSTKTKVLDIVVLLLYVLLF